MRSAFATKVLNEHTGLKFPFNRGSRQTTSDDLVLILKPEGVMAVCIACRYRTQKGYYRHGYMKVKEVMLSDMDAEKCIVQIREEIFKEVITWLQIRQNEEDVMI